MHKIGIKKYLKKKDKQLRLQLETYIKRHSQLFFFYFGQSGESRAQQTLYLETKRKHFIHMILKFISIKNLSETLSV